MRTIWRVLAGFAAAAALVGCLAGPGVGGDIAMGEMMASDRDRVVGPEVPATDVAELSSGNSAFAFDLYQVLRRQKGNVFYSPHSISAALAMTYAGARHETERQMAETLHFTLSQGSLHPAFNALDQELAGRGDQAASVGAGGKDEGGFRLRVVNAIWGQGGYTFLEQFLDTLAESYGAGLRLVDFAKAPEGARKAINDWVSDQTEGRIPDLIPQGVIDTLTRLVLTNAIYFNAAWAYPFPPERTTDDAFYLLDGGEVAVPMMQQTEYFGYVDGEGFQAIELPYAGLALSMVILLPDEGQFEAFEERLDAARLAAVIENLRQRRVELGIPQFEFDAQFMLADALVELGMIDAFTSAADFSGMTGNHDLFISDVIHKAFISVDEAGTEAAAATAVVMKLTAAMPDEPVQLAINRPFIFVIRDIPTGAVLFVGRVLNPASSVEGGPR